MLIGDFDYDSMWMENRWLTPLFFWSFVVLALFLLLNFIIGILADGCDASDTPAHMQTHTRARARTHLDPHLYMHTHV